MERDSYNDAGTADYINSHFVAVKVDYDADSELSAELECAQAFDLPADLPLTAFLTPGGGSILAEGIFPIKLPLASSRFAKFLYRRASCSAMRERSSTAKGSN